MGNRKRIDYVAREGLREGGFTRFGPEDARFELASPAV